jgi:hypothetical protein
MPLQKPDPEKYCVECGARLARKRFKGGVLESMLAFTRRKFCTVTCMAQNFDARPSRSVDKTTTHYHARKLVPPGPCSECLKPSASDVHHLDEDHTNNSPENLLRLCRSCHMKRHRPKSFCSLCMRPVKGYGYCEMHYQRFKRWGDPLKLGFPTKQQCLVCGEPANARSLCGRHYMQRKRAGTLT